MVFRLILSRSSKNGFTASEVDISRCQIAEALMVAVVVVGGDEAPDICFEIAR